MQRNKQSECYVAKYSFNDSLTASLCALASSRLLLDVPQDFETKVFDVRPDCPVDMSCRPVAVQGDG